MSGHIDLAAVQFVSGRTTAGINATDTLLVTAGATGYSQVLTGSYAGDAVTAVAGSAGETLLTLTAPCFAEGTRIATPDGAVAVEALRPGDLVRTASGGTRPVVWVGRRRLDLVRHPAPRQVQPIRILPGAFGPGVPARPLALSPEHAVAIDGHLVPVRLLVNGGSIRRDSATAAITYWHVELDRHDLLLAEGLAAESYLDAGNRAAFENGGAALRLHPDFAAGHALRLAGSCLPLGDAPELVEPIWRRLAARAGALGPGPVAEAPPPELRLLVAGRKLAPTASAGGDHLFLLPAWCREARLVSPSAIPADARPWLIDERRLGVLLRQITLHGDGPPAPALDDPALADGWWAPEWHDGALRRWTDGDALLVLPPRSVPAVLVLSVAGAPERLPTLVAGGVAA